MKTFNKKLNVLKIKKQNYLKSPTTYTKTRYSHNFIQE